jgi:predicted nucleic acid-binding protein
MVIDASVAVKWVADEGDADRAIRLIDAFDLGAPTLLYAEVASAVWKRQRRGEYVRLRLDRLDSGLAWTASERELAGPAHALAVDLNHPVYDCFYLALAILRDLPLMTADERFLRALAPTPHARRVLRFADWAPA